MKRLALLVPAALALQACSHAVAPGTRPQARGRPGAAVAAPHGVIAEPALHRALLDRLAAPVASPCRELDLPKAYVSTKTGHAEEANLGRGLALSLPHGTVVAGRVGQTEIAVYLSYKLNPTSELGDAGYRVMLRDAKGRTKDASLGFAMLRPFVVVPNQALPILEGDVLQLAVDVRQVDDASITFPPVALKATRTAHDKMVRCDLSAVLQDTDADGVTDVEEALLGTDPNDPDTDGDGLSDGGDPAPLGAVAPVTSEDAVRLSALQQLVDQEAKGEFLVMVGEEPRLAVENVSFRLLQLRADELQSYQRRWGRRVTFALKVTMKGPNAAEVDIDYGWRGAGFHATRDPGSGRWTFTVGEEWISMSMGSEVRSG
jgi:hypothetical protein